MTAEPHAGHTMAVSTSPLPHLPQNFATGSDAGAEVGPGIGAAGTAAGVEEPGAGTAVAPVEPTVAPQLSQNFASSLTELPQVAHVLTGITSSPKDDTAADS